MRKIFLVLIWLPIALTTLSITFFLLYLFSTVSAGDLLLRGTAQDLFFKNGYQMYAALPSVLGSFTTAIETSDARPEIIRQYLKKYDSPLFPYADLIVQVSDENQIDFRLLVAIAQQESNLCKKIPTDSYNCWGFGIYGDKVLRFQNYEEAIKKIAKSLKEDYFNKGLITPEQIMARYTPQSLEKGGPWAQAINQFFSEMK